jgi:hypothetical protein
MLSSLAIIGGLTVGILSPGQGETKQSKCFLKKRLTDSGHDDGPSAASPATNPSPCVSLVLLSLPHLNGRVFCLS